MLLRIEDLDRERVKPGASELVLRDLEWLGLDWDGPVQLQSADTSAIARACDDLLARGLAYPCTCTRAEIALSAPNQGDPEPRYPGTCRGRYADLDQAERSSGRAAGLRLLVPPGEIALRDELAGAARFDVAAETGDLTIRRRDGAFAYQIAVVVDDARTGVTEVVRGDDLLPSAARQWLLQNALGLPHPRWFHVPLVTDETGRRLAKRAGDLALASLRERGVDPRAVVAWAARSAGLACAERATAAELAPDFAWTRVPREPARLDAAGRERLLAARLSGP